MRRQYRHSPTSAGWFNPSAKPSTDKKIVRTSRPLGDVVKSRCWCDRQDVMIPREDMLAGFTVSCGRPRCEKIHAVKRPEQP